MKKIFLLAAVCMLMLLATGCAKEDDLALSEYKVSLYYANEAGLEEGNQPSQALLSLEDYSLLCEEGQQYDSLLNKLRKVPEELEGAGTYIREDIQFNPTVLRGDTLYVDFVSEGLHGSSTEEGYLIAQIVNSLLHSFTEAKEVQFLVDGEVVESLMGHFDAIDSYTADSL